MKPYSICKTFDNWINPVEIEIRQLKLNLDGGKQKMKQVFNQSTHSKYTHINFLHIHVHVHDVWAKPNYLMH